ncbi:MAG: glutamate synthase 3 [Clostridiales bacterium]|jgi:sugar phosphate isomerase/epimerase|nr:glutamate synthase 3 [Clostridiales bacterium]
MKDELLVINTLVFLEQMQLGILQQELLKEIHKVGVSNAEIRREFIVDFESELNEIKKKSKEFNINLFYSVPDLLYKNGILQSESIENYFKEAFSMNCTNLKMNIGEVETINEADIQVLNTLCDQYLIKLTVENDQTPEGGKVDKIKRFMDEVTKIGSNVSVTFDIGNWVWQGEDPVTNASLLKEYVSYIHLKDVLGNKPPKLVLLSEGDVDWENTLAILPKNIPLALEYPCGTDAVAQLTKEIAILKERYSF